MTILSAAPLADVLAALDRLATAIERENATLAAGEREQIGALLDGKRAACRDYEEAVETMLGDGRDNLSIDEASRGALQAAVERLGRVSEPVNLLVLAQ